ncbi:MAG: hypothetical protein QM484_10235 [Woeseiaceae bacterium]
MSIKDNANSMTSGQIKRRLKSINTDKSDTKHNLLNFVEQFECLDHIAKSLGLIKEGFLFANRVSWNTVLSNLATTDVSEAEEIKLKEISETISQSSSQLQNQLVPQLQRLRNSWMLEVILIEFVFLGLLALVVGGITHIQGLWNLSNLSSMSFSVQDLLYERPIFSLVAGILLFISFIWIHFGIRHFVAAKLARKLNKEVTEFDLVGAFLKHTRIQHSIFRPDIIGWSGLNRKCLIKTNIK